MSPGRQFQRVVVPFCMVREQEVKPVPTQIGMCLFFWIKTCWNRQITIGSVIHFVLLGCDLGTEINPILYTKKEWEGYSFTPFYENVSREGIILV